MKILLVDGPYLAHRSYYAPYKLTTNTGLSAKMLHSFLRTTLSLYKKFQPNKTIVAWESFGTKPWRNDIHPNYKQQRGAINTDYHEQVKDLQMVLHFLNIEQFYAPENEADDVIATFVFQTYQKFEAFHYIFSSDKDLMQLVDNTCTFMYDGKTLYDKQTVKEKFRVNPEQIPDLLALWGDVADNIEGIKGFGVAKASKLVNQYGSIEAIPKTVDIDKKQALLNKKLTILNHHCVLEPIPNKSFKTNETLITLLDKYHLNSIKKDLTLYKKIGGENEES